MDFIKEVDAARKRLKDAERDYEKRLKGSQSNLKSATNNKQKALDKIKKDKDSYIKGRTMRIASFKGITLYGNKIQDKATALDFTHELIANIEVGGQLYTTQSTKSGVGLSLGGAAVGALIAGPLGAVIAGKKNKVNTKTEVHDDRKVYLTFTSDQGQLFADAEPAEEAQARKFISQVITACSNYDTDEVYEKKLKEFDEQYNLIEQDNSAIDSAASALAAAQGGDSAVQEAKQALDTLLANASAEEKQQLAKHDAQAKRMNILKKIGIGIVVLIVIGAMANVYSAQKAEEAARLEQIEQEKNKPVALPDVVGKTASEAYAELKKAGFSNIEMNSTNGKTVINMSNWKVLSMDPASALEVKKDQEIKLTVESLTAAQDAAEEAKHAAEEAKNKAKEELSKTLNPFDAALAVEQYGRTQFPYGFKLDKILGKIAEEPVDGEWFMKYECEITNMYGATLKTTCEARVGGTTNNPVVTYFYVYGL